MSNDKVEQPFRQPDPADDEGDDARPFATSEDAPLDRKPAPVTPLAEPKSGSAYDDDIAAAEKS